MYIFTFFAVELFIGDSSSYHLPVVVLHLLEMNKLLLVVMGKRRFVELVSGRFCVASICTGYYV